MFEEFIIYVAPGVENVVTEQQACTLTLYVRLIDQVASPNLSHLSGLSEGVIRHVTDPVQGLLRTLDFGTVRKTRHNISQVNS